jgi:hypothetical protein
MDGPFWVDLRAPHMAADAASVTMATTNKAVVPVANLPVLGSNYFGFIGKAVRIRIWGQMSTGTTPGNLSGSLYWGTGADANGTAIVSMNATTLSASQTNISWEWDLIVRCRTLGATGALIAHGMFNANVALIASTLQPVMLPASAAAATTVDLTANNVLSPQLARSGSTAESLIVHEMTWEALN